MYLPWWWLAQGSIYTWLYIHCWEILYSYLNEYQIYTLFCILNDFLTIIKLLLEKYIMIHLLGQEACVFNVSTYFHNWHGRFSSTKTFISIVYDSLNLFIVGLENNSIFCSTKYLHFRAQLNGEFPAKVYEELYFYLVYIEHFI